MCHQEWAGHDRVTRSFCYQTDIGREVGLTRRFDSEGLLVYRFLNGIRLHVLLVFWLDCDFWIGNDSSCQANKALITIITIETSFLLKYANGINLKKRKVSNKLNGIYSSYDPVTGQGAGQRKPNARHSHM